MFKRSFMQNWHILKYIQSRFNSTKNAMLIHSLKFTQNVPHIFTENVQDARMV